MAADGKIVIETAIDTDGFTADTRKLEAAAKKAAEKLDDLGASVKQSIGKSATDASFNATEAVRKLSMQAQEAAKKRMEEFRQIDAVYRQQKEATAELQRQLEEQAKTGVKTEQYIALEKEMDKLNAALDKLIEKQNRYIETGGKTKTQTFRGMEYDIDQLIKKIDVLRARKTALEASGGAYTTPPAVTPAVAPAVAPAVIPASTEAQTSRLATAFAMLRARIAEYVATSRFAQNAQLVLQRSAAALGTVLRSISGGVLKAASAGFKSLGARIKATNQRMRSGMGRTLGMSLAMSGLFMAIRGATTAFRDGIQNLAKYDKQTNSAMSGLKSSLSQVKNSLATAFSPILTAVAPAINTLLGLISKALNAIGEFVAALTGQNTFTRATAVQENFAESLGGTASAAKEAQKQMSGLDEMTTWQSKSSGGGGGGGGGAGAGAFETVDITNSPFAKLGQQIKKLIEQQDFRGVGDVVAQKVNAAVGSWDGTKAGKTLSQKIEGVLESAVGFLEGVDWENLGQQIVNFVTSIDWSEITSLLFEGLGAATGGLLGFLYGIVKDAIIAVQDWMYEVGQMSAEELLNGISEGMEDIGTWIYDHIFKPFVDGFCEAFGIHSPSTVMYDLGLQIVQGMVNAIKSIPQKAERIFESARSGIKNVLNSISSFLGSTFKTDWSKKIGALGDPLNALLTNIKNIWGGVKTTFNGIITFVKGVFTGDWKKAWTGVQTAFSGVFTTLKSIAKAPLNSIIGLINGLITALNSMIRGLNKIKVNIPSWVPGLGGQSIGFNIPQISKVPYLATGAVIPPNAPFAAVLGDQRHGTNLEAPESLIRQIVREESGRGGGSWTFTAQINRRTLFREMIEEAKLQQARTGKDPFALA